MRLGRRREQADVQVHVEEDRRDIGAVQHILQIVGGGPLAVQRFLKLAVERGQFLVERLQFLLRGEQLLVGGLEFLVDRQGLLVDRLLLLARDLQIANGALQFRSRRLQLLFEFGDARNLTRRDGAAFAALLPGFVIEETDQRQLLAVAQDRPRRQAETKRLAVALDAAAVGRHRRIVLEGPLNRRSELGRKAFARHGQQVVGRLPRRERSGSDPSARVKTGIRSCDRSAPPQARSSRAPGAGTAPPDGSGATARGPAALGRAGPSRRESRIPPGGLVRHGDRCDRSSRAR